MQLFFLCYTILAFIRRGGLLRRLIQNKVVDGIANLIIDGKLGENDVVLIDVNDDGDIVVSRDDKASEESHAHHSAAPEDVPVEPDAVE